MRRLHKNSILSVLLALGIILYPILPLNPAAFTTTVYASEDAASCLQNPFPVIQDPGTVDYMAYIPTIRYSADTRKQLAFQRPALSVKASSVLLLKEDGTILYYKNTLKPVFPASTAKLLSVLTAADWCTMSEKVTVGNEIEMIAEDASVAGLTPGDTITVKSLIAAMLLPSGNDAAYALAAYVGKKSLDDPETTPEAAVIEFVRLMNEKAIALGAEHSCFVTPDGYDAIGQYTTAYDMGKIAVAIVKNKTVLAITQKCQLGIKLADGRSLSLKNTNLLVNKTSEWYNPAVIGLKTGTTEMAGRCLISAAKGKNGYVISIVMNSTTTGRWSDSNKLLQYGLAH